MAGPASRLNRRLPARCADRTWWTQAIAFTAVHAPHTCEPARASGRDGAELLHHGDAVELRPDVGHATVLETVEVHALHPDRLAGGGDPHELLPQRTGQDPPGGDGVAAGDDVLQVLLQVGEDRLEARDLRLE